MPFFKFLIYLKNKIMSLFRYDINHITIKEMNKLTDEYLLYYENENKYNKYEKDIIAIR